MAVLVCGAWKLISLIWLRPLTPAMKALGARRFAAAVPSLSVDQALFDGEAVALRNDARSHFHALMTKLDGAQATFVASDLLRLSDDDLRLRSIDALWEALMGLVADVNASCSA
jgi:ATP-dependent DNA ligase